MKIGFIGMGNMAFAIASGIINNGLADKNDVYAYAPHYDKLCKNAEILGFHPCRDLKEMISGIEVAVMACKPYQIEGVLSEIKDELKNKALLSIAAGWGFEKYAQFVDPSTRVQFIMPNTPVMVGSGVLMFEEKNSLNDKEREEIIRIFSALGMVATLPGHLMDIGSAIAGCGPAFIDLIIEALGDAGVKYGLSRSTAYALASKMIEGSARLQSKTGEHPGVLKDNVCSPAGTTILGVDALEHAGVRAAFIDAVDKIMQK